MRSNIIKYARKAWRASLLVGLSWRLCKGLLVTRFKKHMDVSITMGATSGGPAGVDGQCGNFNGDPADDTAALIEDATHCDHPTVPHRNRFFWALQQSIRSVVTE
eukprot:4776653-Amphidinium_carterae.2